MLLMSDRSGVEEIDQGREERERREGRTSSMQQRRRTNTRELKRPDIRRGAIPRIKMD